MYSDVFHYEQPVSAGGYCWLNGDELEFEENEGSSWLQKPREPSVYRDVIINPSDLPSDPKIRRPWVLAAQVCDSGEGFYRPRDLDVEEPALFREFARLNANDRDQILRFANAYGCMGSRELFILKSPPPRLLLTRGQELRLEPQSAWAAHIHWLNEAVYLLDRIAAGDADALRPHFRWNDGKGRLSRTAYLFSGLNAFIPRPDNERWVGWSRNAPLFPKATSWVAVTKTVWCFRDDPEIRDSLPDDCPIHLKKGSFAGSPDDSPVTVARLALDELISRGLDETVEFRFGTFGTDTSRGVSFIPRNLIGLLWLQLARATAGGKTYRECDVCQKPFEVLRSHRRKKRFCSPRCKLVEYRSRPAAAKPAGKRVTKSKPKRK